MERRPAGRAPLAGVLAGVLAGALAARGVARAQAPDPRWGRAVFDTLVADRDGAARLAFGEGVLRVRYATGPGSPRPLVLPLTLVAEADSAVRARVLDARRGAGTLYILLLAVGARRTGSDGGPRCPDATTLVWLAVAPGPTLAASRAVALQSCLDLVRSVAVPDLSPPPAFEGDVLRVLFEVGPPWRRRWVVYDRCRPQRGLTGNYAHP